MAVNLYVNKVVLANGTPIIDITDTTAVASDVAQGKYFYTADGAKTEGTASGGGGTTYVTTFDEDMVMRSGYPGWSVYEYYLVPFLANQTYRITWNGVPYICETQVAPSSDVYDGYMVGNASITGGGSDTGEPFIMYRQDFGDPDPNHVQLALESYATGTVHVKIELAQSGGGSTLIPKTITQNGTYDPADDNADGYSEVTVNVGGGTSWETVYNGQLSVTNTDDGTYFYVTIPYEGVIELNSVWRVTWNGTPYECTATSIGDPMGVPYAIGNDTIIHEQGGDNEPFFIQRIYNDNYLFVFASQSQTVNLIIEKQVSGGGGGATLITKTITANGTYSAEDDDADGYSEVTVALPSGTAGTPTATKGSVSNHSVSVTPSVTNTGGVISGGTLTGTPVTVSASELVSGSETKTANGTYDVTNLSQLVVNVASSSKAIYKYEGLATRTANSYGSTSASVTVTKAGTYNISFVAIRSSSSGTMGTNLYIGSSGKGNNQTFTHGNYGQYVTYSNQTISANTTVTIYATSGSSTRSIYVGQLIVEEV